MTLREDLTSVDSHFAFGENWSGFARQIDARRIQVAEASIRRLVGREDLDGLSFLDVGSGSGLDSLAALRLGCTRLLAIDIDPASVETTRGTLAAFPTAAPCECRRLSVFDLADFNVGTFDVVYSWGVLHHTGAMHGAIDAAARAVAPGGMAVFAFYRKTPLCHLWQLEKRWYSKAPAWAQRLARGIYIGAYWASLAVCGRSPRRYIRTYSERSRGMDFYRNVHDWLGGYPYESISAAEIESYMGDLGFVMVRSFTYAGRLGRLGLFGSGNDEYIFRRTGTTAVEQG